MNYTDNKKELNKLKLVLFDSICKQKCITITTRKVPVDEIPSDIPLSMRNFYSEFAPVNINLHPLNIKFLPYEMVFSFLYDTPSIEFIPIAVKDKNRTIYIDKYSDGSWDERIQLDVGNGKVQILGEDIFDFMANMAKNLLSF